MVLDWKARVILTKLIEGCTSREAAAAAGLTKQGVWKRARSNPEFAQAIIEAREAGKEERTFRMWLRHPFRGKRPPTGKGTGGKPRHTYGRR